MVEVKEAEGNHERGSRGEGDQTRREAFSPPYIGPDPGGRGARGICAGSLFAIGRRGQVIGASSAERRVGLAERYKGACTLRDEIQGVGYSSVEKRTIYGTGI